MELDSRRARRGLFAPLLASRSARRPNLPDFAMRRLAGANVTGHSPGLEGCPSYVGTSR